MIKKPRFSGRKSQPLADVIGEEQEKAHTQGKEPWWDQLWMQHILDAAYFTSQKRPQTSIKVNFRT